MGEIFITFYSTSISPSSDDVLQPLGFQADEGCVAAHVANEREALEAGNTWWDAELFSGNPDWKVLQNLPIGRLTNEEQAFIDGPVETLCAMLNDWDITHNRKDLPQEVWDYIKQQKFCGMIIPKNMDGLEFSETAHSEIVMKIAVAALQQQSR